jgi:hypothetical protein
MNIRIKNRRDLEFDLADLEVMIKDYIEEAGTIVSGLFFPFFLNLSCIHSSTSSKSGCSPKYGS